MGSGVRSPFACSMPTMEHRSHRRTAANLVTPRGFEPAAVESLGK